MQRNSCSTVSAVASSFESRVCACGQLLVYLRHEVVADLARELCAEGTGYRLWMFDVVAPRTLEHTRAIRRRVLAGGNVQMHFALDDIGRFFEPLGWRKLSFRGTLAQAQRLGRSSLPWAARLLLWLGTDSRREEFQRLGGTALLGRADL